jgi:predicted KAP-like P-loop ATPase
MDDKRQENLSGDRPLINPIDDRLGYNPLSKHLAESISLMTSNESIVIGIHGQWGSGKTTFVNFILHYLSNDIKKEKLIYIPFNPWWFSNNEDLIRKFFQQMTSILAKGKTKNNEIRKKVAQFLDVISESPIPYSELGKAASSAINPKQKDIISSKKDLEKILKKEKKKLLVIIDDVDRLSSEEIRQIFQLIKAVADFQNIIYLIIFDKEVAIKALEDIQGISGEAYLEKIIQVPFELPMPDKISLRRLLFEKLEKIISGKGSELFAQSYWSNIYFEGIDHFINTPRDIVRLINGLSITYPPVKGEVNPIDFIAIESIRIFLPIAYEIVRKNPEYFAGYIEMGPYSSGRGSIDAFHENWIKQLPEKDREPIKQLLKRLFPKIESNYGYEMTSRWRRELRICSFEMFPIYFRLAIPLGSISNADMKIIIETTLDNKMFAKELLRLSHEKRFDGTTRVSEFLERLKDYIVEIPIKDIPTMLNTFFDIGDKIPEDRISGLMEYGNDIRIGRVIFKLLRRIEKIGRYPFLNNAFENGNAIATMENIVVSIGQQHGKWTNNAPSPENDQLITKEEFEGLEKILLNKISLASQNGTLIMSSSLSRILSLWREWDGVDKVKLWVLSVIKDDDGLIKFLTSFLNKSYAQTVGDIVVRTRYRLDPKWVDTYIDSSSIIERVKVLVKRENMADDQKIALQQFIKEYEMRIKGEDPNNRIDEE